MNANDPATFIRFAGFIEGGTDYEKVESARKLDPSEFNLNKQLHKLTIHCFLWVNAVLI